METLKRGNKMTVKKYYCDNEITGEPVYRDVNRCYPVDGYPDDPPLWIMALWIIGIGTASICVVALLFTLVD